MELLEKVSEFSNKVLMGVAGFFVAAMIVLTCANIFLRLAWVPLSGTFELMGYFGATATAFALGFTQVKRGHVAVDIVVQRFSKRTQRTLNSINAFVCMVFFAVVAWQVAKYGVTLWRSGEVTETLRIIYYPFAFAVALGCSVLSLVFLTDFLRSTFFAEACEK
jgi:TRAP-type C4-dicarboxylate transport system permease small subunit